MSGGFSLHSELNTHTLEWLAQQLTAQADPGSATEILNTSVAILSSPLDVRKSYARVRMSTDPNELFTGSRVCDVYLHVADLVLEGNCSRGASNILSKGARTLKKSQLMEKAKEIVTEDTAMGGKALVAKFEKLTLRFFFLVSLDEKIYASEMNKIMATLATSSNNKDQEKLRHYYAHVFDEMRSQRVSSAHQSTHIFMSLTKLWRLNAKIPLPLEASEVIAYSIGQKLYDAGNRKVREGYGVNRWELDHEQALISFLEELIILSSPEEGPARLQGYERSGLPFSYPWVFDDKDRVLLDGFNPYVNLVAGMTEAHWLEVRRAAEAALALLHRPKLTLTDFFAPPVSDGSDNQGLEIWQTQLRQRRAAENAGGAPEEEEDHVPRMHKNRRPFRWQVCAGSFAVAMALTIAAGLTALRMDLR